MARPPRDRSVEHIESFLNRCRAAGLAVTPQRLAIFRRLVATDRHPSAEELHAVVRREMPTLSLATVYKTLDTLARLITRRTEPHVKLH